MGQSTRKRYYKPRYTVRVYRPDGFREYSLVATYTCGTSLVAAVRTAERAMAPHTVERTRHGSRELTWHADLMCDGRYVDTCEPRVMLVPSVSDLGWTP